MTPTDTAALHELLELVRQLCDKCIARGRYTEAADRQRQADALARVLREREEVMPSDPQEIVGRRTVNSAARPSSATEGAPGTTPNHDRAPDAYQRQADPAAAESVPPALREHPGPSISTNGAVDMSGHVPATPSPSAAELSDTDLLKGWRDFMRERDEARKEVDELRLVLANDPGENAVLLRAIDYWRREYDRVDEMRNKLAVEVTEARAEVERLRAALENERNYTEHQRDFYATVRKENAALRQRVADLELGPHCVVHTVAKLEALCLRVARFSEQHPAWKPEDVVASVLEARAEVERLRGLEQKS